MENDLQLAKNPLPNPPRKGEGAKRFLGGAGS